MKTWKLVSGILCMCMFAFVTFQSCAAGVANTLQENGDSSGTAGLLVAVMLLAGGIVSVATRKSVGIGGDIALVVMFLLGSLFGFCFSGNFSDLAIWAGWCLICAALALVDIISKRKSKKNEVVGGGVE